MDNIGVRKTFSLILLFYLFFFVLFAFYSFLNFPIGMLLSLYRWPFVWANSLILLIDYLIPITATAAAIAFSVSFNAGRKKLKKSRPFHKLISANLALFITLSVIYTVLVLGVLPYLHEGIDRLFSRTRQAKVFRERAEDFVNQEEYQAALENFELYFTIDRKNEEILELKDDVQLKSISRRSEQNAPPEMKEFEKLEEPRAFELLARARAYFDREDYYSAHYYATLAAETGNVQTEARRLAGKAWQKISSLEPGRADREARYLFERKKDKRGGSERRFCERRYYPPSISFHLVKGMNKRSTISISSPQSDKINAGRMLTKSSPLITLASSAAISCLKNRNR